MYIYICKYIQTFYGVCMLSSFPGSKNPLKRYFTWTNHLGLAHHIELFFGTQSNSSGTIIEKCKETFRPSGGTIFFLTAHSLNHIGR